MQNIRWAMDREGWIPRSSRGRGVEADSRALAMMAEELSPQVFHAQKGMGRLGQFQVANASLLLRDSSDRDSDTAQQVSLTKKGHRQVWPKTSALHNLQRKAQSKGRWGSLQRPG